MCKRLEGESFEDYKVRRKSEQVSLRRHLKGILVRSMGSTNRAELREISFRRKGKGSLSRFLYKKVSRRRKKSCSKVLPITAANMA